MEVAEVPVSAPGPAELLARTRVSLISSGTERMLRDFGRANLIWKARQQPEKLRMALDKVRADGFVPAFEAVRAKLDHPVALGYCNAGTVVEAGPGFSIGERVVSNGPHAEIVRVPVNLCARIPDSVSDEAAAFTVLGAIALEGIRLAQPALGETFVVTGLGLVGLLAVQLLRAHGCRVLGIDPDAGRLELARALGAEIAGPRESEVDGVLIAASTRSNGPVRQAAEMCRKRGRIVLIGVAGLELSREEFYRKELSFQVSCSYGPGRHDPAYEEGGHDYPRAYVRWTARRNFEAVLDMLASGRVDVSPLISRVFPIERAHEAYEALDGSLGILLRYDGEPRAERTIALPGPRQAGAPRVSCIGAGAYATRVLLPAFQKAGAVFETVVSRGGVSAAHAARRFGFREAGTEPRHALSSRAVIIATRHDSHAGLVRAALEAGAHVFVEKPLAISRGQLREIEAAWAGARAPLLMVGFNRRFAPHVRRMKALLSSLREPVSMIMTVNAGAVPADHWTLDRETGGGRIVGEACHFVDLLRHLAGRSIAGIESTRASGNASITLRFADASMGTIHYFTSGHGSFPKERLEIFCAGRVLRLDNFRKLTGWGWPRFRAMTLWRQDKGAAAMAAAFLEAVRSGGPAPIPYDEIIEVAGASLDAAGYP